MIPAIAEFSGAEGAFFTEYPRKIKLIFESGSFSTFADTGTRIDLPIFFCSAKTAFNQQIFEAGVIFITQKLRNAGYALIEFFCHIS